MLHSMWSYICIVHFHTRLCFLKPCGSISFGGTWLFAGVGCYGGSNILTESIGGVVLRVWLFWA